MPWDNKTCIKIYVLQITYMRQYMYRTDPADAFDEMTDLAPSPFVHKFAWAEVLFKLFIHYSLFANWS